MSIYAASIDHRISAKSQRKYTNPKNSYGIVQARFVCIRTRECVRIKVLPPSSWRQATVHRTVAFRWVRVRYLHKAKERGESLSLLLGAGNRTRPGTLLTARDFKSLVSTDFTMPASVTKLVYHTFFNQSSITAGPNSANMHPGSDPGTSSVPADPWLSWHPRSVWPQNRTPYCPPSALPGT